ncbi:MAG: ParM/StbA family protein [Chloroflexi bacterium]|nr:ParM/StbA family protein [Chloroflexota bacterium]
MRIGLDIGYNSTKVMGKGGNEFVFPSVVGTPERASFSLNGNKEFLITLSDNSEAMVGQAAIMQSVFASRREDRDWIDSREYYTLAMAAISEVTKASGDISIVTGLPVAYYQDKEKLQDILMGEHRIKRDSRRWQTINVTAVRVVPQPFGTVLSVALHNSGAALTNNYVKGNIGVIDIGGKTTNILSVYRLTEVSRETTSVNLGAWNAVRQMRTYFTREFPDLELRDHEVNQAMIQRSTNYFGDSYDLTDVVDSVVTPMAEQVIAQASQLWGKAARLDAILIAGGGAHLLGEYVQGYFKHAQILEKPQFANVTGFWKLAQR